MADRPRHHDLELRDFRGERLRAVPVEVAPSTQRAARGFEGLDLERIDPGGARQARLSMHDPQQPDLARGAQHDDSLDGISTVLTPTGPVLAMVEPATLASFERRGPSAAQPVVDTAEEARRIIANARAAARSMLEQAKGVIDAERETAQRAGYEAGHAQGLADADEETAGLVATCERIGVHVMEERQRVLDEREQDVVELAIAIAERIVGASIDVTPEIVVESCASAMRKAFQRDMMQVLANPEDLALLRAAGPRLAEELGGVEHLDFIAERRLDRGSIIVRTPAGEIDATIAGKSDRILSSLREGIEARRAERRAAG